MSTIVIAVVIFVVSLAASFAPRVFVPRLATRQLEDLTGIASGLLLASALLLVVPEGFHVAAEAAEDGDEAFAFPPLVLGATVLAGFAVMLLLEGLGVGHDVHEEHHDHVAGHGHPHVHHPASPLVLALGLSVHAIADGLAIGAAAATGEPAFSLLVGLGVLVHRVPAALSLGLFWRHEHRGPGGSSTGLVLFALATPAAIFVAFALLDGADERVTALALLLSAGTFLYVATVDTLPSIHNPETGRRSVRNVLCSAGLFTLVLFVLQAADLLDHTH